jgi:phage shock protein A
LLLINLLPFFFFGKVFIPHLPILLFMAEPTVDIKEAYELAGYADTVRKRTNELEKTVGGSEARFAELDADLKSVKKKLSTEVAGLKQDVSVIKDGVSEVQKAMIMLISHMKSALKRDDFERFEKKVDAWNAESLVTRGEARRVVRRAQIKM